MSLRVNECYLCPNLILNPLFYDILDNSILPTSWEQVVERSICVLRVQSKVGKVMNIFRINFNSDCEPYSPLFPLLFAFHFLSISRAAILILLPNCNDIHFVILYFLHFLFFFFPSGIITSYGLWMDGVLISECSSSQSFFVVKELSPWSRHVLRLQACTARGCGKGPMVSENFAGSHPHVQCMR